MIINIKQKIKLLSLVLSVSCLMGCTLMDVSPSFKFEEEAPQTALVAFSVACKGVNNYEIRSDIFEIYKNKLSTFTFDCEENGKGQIQILKLPAGTYMFAGIRYSDRYAYHYTKVNKLFFFKLQAHKLNYIGRIKYTIGQYSVLRSVDDASIVDIPQIKLAVPQVSPQDYVVNFWEKDSLGNFRAI